MPPTQVDGTLDIDEVLAAYLDVFLDWHNQQYGTKLQRCHVKGYHLREIINCSWDEERHRLDIFERSPAVLGIKPVAGAVEHVVPLSHEYSLALVTSRPNRMRYLTRHWLLDNFGDAFVGVYHTDHDGYGTPLHTKPELCLKLGARFHIDDSMDHSVACARAGIRVVLFGNCPYNQMPIPDDISNIVRCDDMAATAAYIRQNFKPRF